MISQSSDGKIAPIFGIVQMRTSFDIQDRSSFPTQYLPPVKTNLFKLLTLYQKRSLKRGKMYIVVT